MGLRSWLRSIQRSRDVALIEEAKEAGGETADERDEQKQDRLDRAADASSARLAGETIEGPERLGEGPYNQG